MARRILWSLLIALGPGGFLRAAEPRLWTLRDRDLREGELVSSDASGVTLIDRTTDKQVVMPFTALSLDDRRFLIETAGADPAILTMGSPGKPEIEFHPGKGGFGEVLREPTTLAGVSFRQLKTEHFLILYQGKIQASAFAETAERLWHGIAFQLTGFRRDWGDDRMMIIPYQDHKAEWALGRPYFQMLRDTGRADEAGEAAITWSYPGAQDYLLAPDEAHSHGCVEDSCIVCLSEAKGFTEPMSSLQVHSMARTILSHFIGQSGKPDTSVFRHGYAYSKEIELTGKATTILDVPEGGDRVTVRWSGPQEGWAAELRKLVANGVVDLDLSKTFGPVRGRPSPEEMSELCGLFRYLQHDHSSLIHFSELLHQISSRHGLPSADAIAKIYGFDTVEAFNGAWTKFILSGDFK